MPNRDSRSAPQALLRGRRALEGLACAELVEDLRWWTAQEWWSIRLRLTHDGPTEQVPEETEWYVCSQEVYPLGSIEIFPAKEGGIDATFPHQLYNGTEGNDEVPWRTGKLCVETEGAIFKRRDLTPEPWTADERLRWHVERAIRWLQCAAQGTLRAAGDPFELPDYSTQRSPAVVFREEPTDLDRWRNRRQSYGFAEILYLGTAGDSILAIKSFLTKDGKPLHEVEWGTLLQSGLEEAPKAIWILLEDVPVLEPWQAPMTWGALKRRLRQQDVNLETSFRELVPTLRVGKSQPRGHHHLLLGFPIPETVAGTAQRLHWLALRLPPIARKGTARNGFQKKTEAGSWALDKEKLSGPEPVHWVRSECWNARELGGRGRFCPELCESKLLLIGAGALGSAVAELLVRGGVRHLTIMDDDLLAAGNLVRHTLDLQHLGANKAEGLAKRLEAVAPLAHVEALPEKFSTALAGNDDYREKLELIQGADIVVDLTASDEVLHHLERFPWRGEKLFVSFSLGWKARWLYVCIVRGTRFPSTLYSERIGRRIEKDADLMPRDEELPREGLGCWHPVFPARLDHIWGMAALAVAVLEQAMTREVSEPEIAVFERSRDEADPWELRRVE